MARPLPMVRSPNWYHLANRGIDQATLFPTPRQRNIFEVALGRIAYDFVVEFHAYCALETHYHVLARGEEPELRQALARLDEDCAIKTEGAIFRPMRFGRHMLDVTRYIHRNPVDAGAVVEPGDWRWSSYRAYLDGFHAPSWLQTRAVLECLGSIGNRQIYRRYVEVWVPGSRYRHTPA